MEYPEKQMITWVDDNGEYVGLCEYIRADLVPQWQPIETAPKDGTLVLVRTASAGTFTGYFCAYWADGGFMYCKDVYVPSPTQWMQIPPT
jgi:hypothetical protein